MSKEKKKDKEKQTILECNDTFAVRVRLLGGNLCRQELLQDGQPVALLSSGATVEAVQVQADRLLSAFGQPGLTKKHVKRTQKWLTKLL